MFGNINIPVKNEKARHLWGKNLKRCYYYISFERKKNVCHTRVQTRNQNG